MSALSKIVAEVLALGPCKVLAIPREEYDRLRIDLYQIGLQTACGRDHVIVQGTRVRSYKIIK